MRVLVTGASGYLGRQVVQALLDAGHEVTATSRDLDKARKVCCWFSQVRFVAFDLAHDSERPPFHFDALDTVVHLAWDGLPDYANPRHYERELWSSYSFLKHCAKHGVRRFVVAGTCLEYGLREGPLTEDMAPQPVTAYGLAKDTLRRFLEQVCGRTGAQMTWLRFFYLHGGDTRPHSLLAQLDRAVESGDGVFNMSRGEQLRDFLSVEQAAAITEKLLRADDAFGIINCCSGKPISVRRFVEEYLAERGLKLRLNLGYYPYPDYEPMAFWGDTRKLRSLLGDHL